jgi:hypothetical protein
MRMAQRRKHAQQKDWKRMSLRELRDNWEKIPKRDRRRIVDKWNREVVPAMRQGIAGMVRETQSVAKHMAETFQSVDRRFFQLADREPIASDPISRYIGTAQGPGRKRKPETAELLRQVRALRGPASKPRRTYGQISIKLKALGFGEIPAPRLRALVSDNKPRR